MCATFYGDSSTWNDQGHGHSEAHKGSGEDDLAEEALHVPLGVVEPLDVKGADMTDDKTEAGNFPDASQILLHGAGEDCGTVVG